MQWLTLIPLVVKLVSFVEPLFAAKGQGTIKKAIVEGAVQAAVETGAAVSSGGQKETWEALKPFVGSMVDGIVAVNNAIGWTSIVDESLEVRRQAGVL